MLGSSKEVKKIYIVAETVICNKCHKVIDVESLEYDEMFSYSFEGGYTSIFGDGFRGRIDLCQECFKTLMGQYLESNYDV